MDDRRILADIERRLARDDPELASLMDALNQQFPEGCDDGGNDKRERRDWRDWRVVTAVVLAIVALLGLILMGIFAKPTSTEDDHGRPNRIAPNASVQTQHRDHRSRIPPGRRARHMAAAGPLSAPVARPRRHSMRARDLAEPYVSVSKDSDAVDAVRLLAERRLPGLLVVDTAGRPYAILPACAVIRALAPGYGQEDSVLVDVIDELHADQLRRALVGWQVADCLPLGRPFLPTAGPDWTAMEVANLMARTRSPFVAIVDRSDRDPCRLLGVVTAAHLLERLLQAT